jgi:hypothetical protein
VSDELEPAELLPQTTDQARQRQGGSPPQYQRPDFMIVGLTLPAGDVLVFASTELTQAQLVRETQGFDLIEVMEGMRLARVPIERITVRAEMRSFTIIHGDDYPSALRSLMEMWARKAHVHQRGIEQ